MTRRWLWFGAAVVCLALGSWLLVFRLSSPPIPQPCDSQQIIADQQAQVGQLAAWISQIQVAVGLFAAALVFSALYLQLAHTWPRIAFAGFTCLLFVVPAAASASAFQTRISGWLLFNNGSCLSEAARTGQAAALSVVGQHLLAPDRFLMGIAAQAALVACAGVALGWSAYLLSRRAIRL